MKKQLGTILFGLTAAVAVVVLSGSSALAAGWGTITGRFVLDGATPAPVKINVNKDEEVCGKHNLVDEGLVVGKDGAIEGVAIYLRTKMVPVHPDYEKTANATIGLDNKNCRYEPHVIVLRNTQTLQLKNTDPVGHNVKIDSLINPPINVLIPAGAEAPVKFPMEEGLPVKVGCNIHPWMGGWIIMKSNPYAAVTGKDGKFEIKDAPAGTPLEFVFWQEKSGYVKDVTFKGGKADTKGRFTLTLKPGVTDLGDIKVPVKLFAK